MVERIIGILRLDVNTYEEIEADPNATTEAAIIVAAVALLSGIGSGLGGRGFFGAFLSTFVWAFASWYLWAMVSLWVGTNMFGGKSDMVQMLRVIGYAQAPQMLGIIPCFGTVIGLVWSLVTGLIAVRQGLDLEDDTQAFLTIVVGFIVVLVGQVIIRAVFGTLGAIF